jgi:hypothetical protein
MLLTWRILQFATQVYFQTNIVIEQKTVRKGYSPFTYQIKLPKVCSWYAADFGITKANVMEFLTPILNVEQSNKLERLRASDLQIAYCDYSWDLYIDPTKFYGCN